MVGEVLGIGRSAAKLRIGEGSTTTETYSSSEKNYLMRCG